MNLTQFKEQWRNTQDVNQHININFSDLTNKTPFLKEHRDWVESKIFGFGERSFHWLHKIIVDEMPERFKFLEVGGFRMQVVSLYKLLANHVGKHVTRYCVSPMSSMGGHWESDYFADSELIHAQFGLDHDYILYHGSSIDEKIIDDAKMTAPYEVVYIDGGHSYPVVYVDIREYSEMVKPGGYLVVDDCSNNLNMWPGCFAGIADVSRAVDEYMNNNTSFEHIGAVMHNRVWRRKA